MNIFPILLALMMACSVATAQMNIQLASFASNQESIIYSNISGSIHENNSDATMSSIKIIILNDRTKEIIATTYTDQSGNFTANLPRFEAYEIIAQHQTYFKCSQKFVTDELETKLNLKMERKPGYVFDVTVFEGGKVKSAINTIADAKIEIYNNTTRTEELVLDHHPKPTFHYTFQEGNHYTIMVRKEGYLNRRIEAYVDIEGCILCFDGMGVEQPDVVSLMHHNNELGFFLGAISLDSIQVGKTFAIDNIYYDFDQSYIRPDAAKELNKLAEFLKDNPGITVELSSHTDARGSNVYNQTLSERRAISAVDYIVKKQGIATEKIEAKGYGESNPVNECIDGVTCNETMHQKNRRTELKITGVAEEDPLRTKSLKQLIEDPNLYRKILEEEKKAKEEKAKQ